MNMFIVRCRTCYPHDHVRYGGNVPPLGNYPVKDCPECEGKGKTVVPEDDLRDNDIITGTVNELEAPCSSE